MHHIKQTTALNCEWKWEKWREGERTVHSLCWHNPSHFSHNMDWTTHSQGLLTTCKCYCHTINCRQTSISEMITTHGAVLQALFAWYGARVEVHSYYTTYACLLTTGQHLCVCLSYKLVASVVLNAMFIVETFVSNWRWPVGLYWLILKFSVWMWEVLSLHCSWMSHSFTPIKIICNSFHNQINVKKNIEITLRF